jgi:tetratricopeptide (TPR) repeat protein
MSTKLSGQTITRQLANAVRHMIGFVLRLFVFRTPKWDVPSAYLKPTSQGMRSSWRWLNPLSWLKWGFEFGLQWFTTRPLKNSLQTIPFVAVVLVAGLGTLDLVRNGVSVRRGLYSQKVEKALQAKDFAEAALSIKVLMDLQPDNENLALQIATIEWERGNRESALKIMEDRLAKSSSGNVAFWLVKRRFELAKLSEWSRQDHEDFGRLMEVAINDAISTDLRERQLVMAQYLVGINAGNEAVAFLTGLVPSSPDLALPAATLSLTLDRRDDAKRFATKAAEFYRGLLTTNSNDDETRMQLARALVILEKEVDAFRVLQESSTSEPKPQFLIAKADALVAWSARLKRESPGDTSLQDRVRLIAEATKYAPAEMFVLNSLVNIAIECRKSKDQEARSMVGKAIANVDGKAVHFLRGTIAVMEGEMEKAVQELSLANQGDSTSSGTLNNLAVALYSKDDKNLDEALRLVEMSVREIPNHPYFLETRGQILARMGRNEEAIRDLEYASRVPELVKDVLPTLIQCYRKLGLDDMARQYEAVLKSQK